MGRRRNDSNPTDVIFVIIFLAIVCYFLLKWILTILIFIIAGIMYFIGWIIKNIKEQRKKKSSQEMYEKQEQKRYAPSSTSTPENSNSNLLAEPVQNIKDVELKGPKEINRFKTRYDYLFQSSIISRGIDYYLGNKIVDYKRLKTKCTCISKGTEDYKTEIFIDANGNYKNGKCTCPYYQDKEHLCKHIYGLLLKYCIEEEIPVTEENSNMFHEITDWANPMSKEIDGLTEKVKQFNTSVNNLKSINENTEKKGNNQKMVYSEIVDEIEKLKSSINDADSIYHHNEFDDIEIDAIYSDLDTYKKKLQEYENLKIVDISEEILESINDDIDEVQNIIDLLEEEIDDATEIYELEQEDEDISFGEALGTGLALHYLNEDRKKKKEEEDYEKELQSLKDAWGLNDYEADLVEQERYNPWNFGNDKEDLEEDDYHYEDDI